MPTFRDYLHVMRYQPGFWLKVLSVCAFATATILRGDGLVLAYCLAGFPVFLVLWFPFWRRLAVKRPGVATFGAPWLLDGHRENPDRL